MRTGYNDGFPVFAGLSPMSATPLAASVPLDASYTRGAALPALLKSRILILDGAMGTMIQRYKLDEAAYRGERFKDFPRDIKGNNELLSITQPQIIREIHDQYFAAGADIVETNTFGATTVAQSDYEMEDLVVEMNIESAKLAREAAEKYATPENRASSRARSGRRRKRPASRRTSTTRAHATSRSTSCARRTTSRRRRCSTAASTCSSSRRSSTR